MNIHEYQAKELFQKFGVATSPGKVARTAEEAEAVARELGEQDIVVKAQIHAGGRGKGTFKNGFKGGVHLVKSAAEAKEVAGHMLGQTLVTHQTGPDGRVVNQVLVARSVDIAKEFYFAIVMDRATGKPTLIASTEGGVEIEQKHLVGNVVGDGLRGGRESGQGGAYGGVLTEAGQQGGLDLGFGGEALSHDRFEIGDADAAEG